MSQQPSAIRSRTISLASAALSWPGGQSKDCIISHTPVRRYLPFRPPTHRSWPLRYRDYARSAKDNGLLTVETRVCRDQPDRISNPRLGHPTPERLIGGVQ